MFERYTEKARRTIFFARYEASQFGSQQIETEHLLLGVFREDKVLTNQFLGSCAKFEVMRRTVEQRAITGVKIPTSVDLPLSHECKRVLAYGAEEAERMHHKHIGTPHLLLGMLRETKSFAAQLLGEQGITLESVREQVCQSEFSSAQGGSVSMAGLEQWLAEGEAQGKWIVQQKRVGSRTTQFAFYAASTRKDDREETAPGQKLAEIRRRLDFLIQSLENAIANHEFEKARLYSDEERKEREKMRQLREQFNLEEPPPQVPLLCIEIIRGDLFSQVRKRCDEYITQGVGEVWLLDPELKCAYTVTKSDGLREFKGEVLQIRNPPLEMDLTKIFDEGSRQ
jgi:hypothetical protein